MRCLLKWSWPFFYACAFLYLQVSYWISLALTEWFTFWTFCFGLSLPWTMLMICSVLKHFQHVLPQMCLSKLPDTCTIKASNCSSREESPNWNGLGKKHQYTFHPYNYHQTKIIHKYCPIQLPKPLRGMQCMTVCTSRTRGKSKEFELVPQSTLQNQFICSRTAESVVGSYKVLAYSNERSVMIGVLCFDSMPLCVSSVLCIFPSVLSPLCFPSLPHLSSSLLTLLTCSWSPH